MRYLEKIRTYLIVSDTTHYLDPLIGTQSFFYEVDQFIPPKLTSFNSSTLMPENNEISLVVRGNVNEIVDMFLNVDIIHAGRPIKRIVITVVKFWGNVSQEFNFSGASLSTQNNSTLEFRFDRQSFSEKNSDNNKYWVKMLIPRIREEKLNTILGT